MLKIDGVTHWSIPVNDLDESERFYRDLLGLEYRGRLGNSHMACFHVGGHDILGVKIEELTYRAHGFFTGRELYFLDPSGNLLEVRDPTWTAGMPTPSLADIVGDGSPP
jgi:catechol 2,3-dioxygenase-like lactoylglutathione lyase family enzyme